MGKKKDLKKCEKLLTELLYETRMVRLYLKDIDEKLIGVKDDSEQPPRTFDEWTKKIGKRDRHDKSLSMEDIQTMCPKEYW